MTLKGAIVVMLDGVVECLVERKKTGKVYVIRGLVFFVDSILLALSVFIFLFLTAFSATIFIFAAIGALITWLAIRSTNIEYEYSFFENELTIDRIVNKSKRKRLKSFDLSKMELMAPAGSKRLGGNPDNNRRKLNFSALDENYINYVIVVLDDMGTETELTFTPNEKLIDVIKRKYPRKVYGD